MEGEIAAFGESHSATIGGFDFIYEDELSQEQKCPICLLAMRNPVQTRCGHRFCESCLLESFRCVCLGLLRILNTECIIEINAGGLLPRLPRACIYAKSLG